VDGVPSIFKYALSVTGYEEKDNFHIGQRQINFRSNSIEALNMGAKNELNCHGYDIIAPLGKMQS
jgi:hypothetical protein